MSKKVKKKENHKSAEKVSVKAKDKKISPVKLVYLIISLLVLGMVILYSSDTFDSVPVAGGSQNTNFNQPHSSADLSKLNEIKQLENAVKANPNDLSSLLHLGHVYNDSGFKEKAIEKYKLYLSKRPNEPDVLVDMGVCYFELNDNEVAIRHMEKALTINPNHQIAYFNLGIVNFSSGNLKIAKEYWQKTIDINSAADVAQRAKDLLKSH